MNNLFTYVFLFHKKIDMTYTERCVRNAAILAIKKEDNIALFKQREINFDVPGDESINHVH